MTNEMCSFDKGLRRCEVCALPIRELLNRFSTAAVCLCDIAEEKAIAKQHTPQSMRSFVQLLYGKKRKKLYREDILFLSMHCVCAAYMRMFIHNFLKYRYTKGTLKNY